MSGFTSDARKSCSSKKILLSSRHLFLWFCKPPFHLFQYLEITSKATKCEDATYWEVISELQWINEHKSCSLDLHRCIKDQKPSELSENWKLSEHLASGGKAVCACWAIMLSSVAKGQGSKPVGRVHLVSIWSVITSSLKTLRRKFKDRVDLLVFLFFFSLLIHSILICVSGSLLCLPLWKTQALSLWITSKFEA